MVVMIFLCSRKGMNVSIGLRNDFDAYEEDGGFVFIVTRGPQIMRSQGQRSLLIVARGES